MKINPGITLTHDDTNLILMGDRQNLYIEETIGISNRFSSYIEVNLQECGITNGITSFESMHRVVHKVLAYLNHNNMIDKRVYRDVRTIMGKPIYRLDIETAIDTHLKLLHEPYDDIPGVIISPDRRKISLSVPSPDDTVIHIVFIIKGKQYQVITNISEPKGKTVTATRWRKITSGYSLLNQLSDWSNDINVSADNSRLIKTYLPDIREYFLCEENLAPLKLLVRHINEYTGKINVKG